MSEAVPAPGSRSGDGNEEVEEGAEAGTGAAQAEGGDEEEEEEEEAGEGGEEGDEQPGPPASPAPSIGAPSSPRTPPGVLPPPSPPSLRPVAPPASLIPSPLRPSAFNLSTTSGRSPTSAATRGGPELRLEPASSSSTEYYGGGLATLPSPPPGTGLEASSSTRRLPLSPPPADPAGSRASGPVVGPPPRDVSLATPPDASPRSRATGAGDGPAASASAVSVGAPAVDEAKNELLLALKNFLTEISLQYNTPINIETCYYFLRYIVDGKVSDFKRDRQEYVDKFLEAIRGGGVSFENIVDGFLAKRRPEDIEAAAKRYSEFSDRFAKEIRSREAEHATHPDTPNVINEEILGSILDRIGQLETSSTTSLFSEVLWPESWSPLLEEVKTSPSIGYVIVDKVEVLGVVPGRGRALIPQEPLVRGIEIPEYLLSYFTKESLRDIFLETISKVSDASNTNLQKLSGFVEFSDSDVATEVKKFSNRLGELRLETAFLGDVESEIYSCFQHSQAILQDLEDIQDYVTESTANALKSINFRDTKIAIARSKFQAINGSFVQRTQGFRRLVSELKIEPGGSTFNPLSASSIQEIVVRLEQIKSNIGEFGNNCEQNIKVLEYYRELQMQILKYIRQGVSFRNTKALEAEIISDVKFVEETLQVLKAIKVVLDALVFVDKVRFRKDFASFVTLEVNARDSDSKLDTLARDIDLKIEELLPDKGSGPRAPSALGATPFAGVAATTAASGGPAAAVPAGAGGPASVASAVPGAVAPPAVSAAGGVGTAAAPELIEEEEKYKRAYCLAVLRTQITTASRLRDERADRAVTEEDLRLRRRIEDVPARFLNYTANRNLGLRVTVRTVGREDQAFTEIRIDEVIKRAVDTRSTLETRNSLLKGVTISIREGDPPLDHAQLIRDLRELGVEGALNRQGKAPIEEYLEFYKNDDKIDIRDVHKGQKILKALSHEEGRVIGASI